MKNFIIIALLSLGLSQTEQPLNFNNDGLKFEGWLTKPAGNKPFPVVVLIHGSGGMTAKNRAFRFLARQFNANGIAVYYYEKRGVGGSEGDYKWTSFNDLAGDVVAAVHMLKERDEIKADQIGVWGISQGGWLGPLAASKTSDIKFVIAASGPAVSPYKQHLFDVSNRFRSKGLSEVEVTEAIDLLAILMDYYGNPTHELHQKAQIVFEKSKKKKWFQQVEYIELQGVTDSLSTPKRIIELQKKISGLHFYATGNHYDPIPTLKKLNVPFLAIFGEKDRLVDVNRTVPIIRNTFKLTGKIDYQVKIFKDANHGIAISSFNLNDDPYAPGYMTLMVKWIKNRLK